MQIIKSEDISIKANDHSTISTVSVSIVRVTSAHVFTVIVLAIKYLFKRLFPTFLKVIGFPPSRMVRLNG